MNTNTAPAAISIPRMPPTAPAPVRAPTQAAHGTIVVDENRCKGCGLCVGACPRHIIGFTGYFTPRGYHAAHLDNASLCTGCALCATMCPDAAITVYRATPFSKS
jgi:2-oxoglutarate ferredoxin oxidoreductase subunit delta